jgi:UPF0716 protein FxsA
MNLAKYLLLTAILAVLLLPLMELAAFIAVAAQIGFLPALVLIAAGSLAGALLLRHAGGSHIARVRVALGEGSFTTLQTDGSGTLVLLAGILLAIPGFITDILDLLLLIAPLRRGIASTFGRGARDVGADGVVDLPPEQWRRVPDPKLPDRRES